MGTRLVGSARAAIVVVASGIALHVAAAPAARADDFAFAAPPPCAPNGAPPPPCVAPCDPCDRCAPCGYACFQTRPPKFVLESEYGFPADIEGGRGDISVFRMAGEFEAESRLSCQWAIRWRLRAENSIYDLSDSQALVAGPGRLIETAQIYRFAPLLEMRSLSGWGFDLGPVVQWSGVPGAEFSDALTWGVEGSVYFPIGGGKRIGVGVRYETRVEDEPVWTPVVHFEGGPPGSGHFTVESRGLGARVGYAFTPCFSVGLEGRRDRRDFRLAEDDRVPGGVFRDRRWAFGADLEWKPSCNTSLSAVVWRNFDTRIRVHDRDDNVVIDTFADDSWQVGLRFAIEF